MTTDILTFGCRLNAYESEVIRSHTAAAGLDDVIVVNTCAVTKEAERQAQQAIRKARRQHPDKKIIVTGCAAQISPELYADMDEVSHVVGNDLKLKGETWAGLTRNPESASVIVNDIMTVEETASHLIDGLEGRARAFLQVQQGCDHRCTFCIIPYGRGNSRSVSIGDIVNHTRHLVEQGVNEIVLTGVDVTSYGSDLPGQPKLGEMMKRLLTLVPELPRIRLSSLDPVEIDDDLWRLIAEEERLMPHLHLSAQAGDDMILKRMKRRHLRQDIIDVAKRAKDLRPDIVFGADLIAGFPTETDEMFENTFRVVEEADLTYLHVFPYSEREGTPAAKMPQVHKPLRKERAGRLREIGEKKEAALYQSEVGKQRKIIIEKNQKGRTEHFIPVHFEGDVPEGALKDVKITSYQDGQVHGILTG